MCYDTSLALDILKQIETDIHQIEQRTEEIHSASDFLTTPGRMEKLDAVCMKFIAVGESLKGLDKVTHKKLLITDTSVPWRKIMGLRDIIPITISILTPSKFGGLSNTSYLRY